MNNWQKKILVGLPAPATYEDLKNMLSRREYLKLKEYADGRFIKLYNVENDALLLGDPEFAQSFLFDVLHVSSTIKVIPHFGNTRMLTFLLGQHHHYVFPIAIILWSTQTYETCATIMYNVRNLLIPGIHLRKVYTDFDFKGHIQTIFPESQVCGTFNNYCRILFFESFEKNLRFVNVGQENFLRNCMSLILLPREMIADGFQELINSLTPQLQNELSDFINYFQETWIQGVGVESMSLFEDTDSLNTVPVLFWSLLHNNMNDAPSLWEFIKELIIIMNKSKKEIERLNQSRSSYISLAPRVRLCFPKKLIVDLWKSLKQGKVTVQQFLASATTYHTDHYHDLLHHAEVLREEQLDLYPRLDNNDHMRADNREEAEDLQHLEIGHEINDGIAEYLEPITEQDNEEDDNMNEENFDIDNNENNAEEENDEAVDIQNICMICVTEARKIICIPCNHYGMCYNCSQEIRKVAAERRLQLKCPFCNEPVQKFSRVFEMITKI
ncbi:uncharacterized protein LOC103574443 [Microplitis demolitor]|uniref:uncharacterized protein LOC103574443 n=1 Tax=Microplitis demolitor TaxID=69319 RepID=UPI0004CD27EB|nr:uncharacterized protein LOC103574443 [Microplitis demolitor]